MKDCFIKKFLKLKSETGLFLFTLVFIFLKWPDLSLPIFDDEMSYAALHLWHCNWSFFLPWNYDSNLFMGHPFGHPFILYTAFSIFGPSIFVAKAVSLFMSLFFLVTLYKMTELVFKNSVTAFYSVLVVMFLPLFWTYSSLIFSEISELAFGFGSIYAFVAKRHKSLFLFSLGLRVIRESALAFFVPLILYGLAIPSYRKLLSYLLPGLLLFVSHFLINFLKYGSWLTHPFITTKLPHNLNPKFFDFSAIPVNIIDFCQLILDVFPLLFLLLALAALSIFSFLKQHKKSIFGKEALIPLACVFLCFSFWILYPEQTDRNYFSLLMFLTSFGIHFIVRVIPYYHVFVIIIILYSAIQSVHLKSYENSKSYSSFPSQKEILEAKAFISYLNKTYGDKIRHLEKRVFSTWPECNALTYPEYEYIKSSLNADCHCPLSKIKEYRVAVFRNIFKSCLPFYSAIKASSSFILVKTPFKNYELFLHKDLLEQTK